MHQIYRRRNHIQNILRTCSQSPSPAQRCTSSDLDRCNALGKNIMTIYIYIYVYKLTKWPNYHDHASSNKITLSVDFSSVDIVALPVSPWIICFLICWPNITNKWYYSDTSLIRTHLIDVQGARLESFCIQALYLATLYYSLSDFDVTSCNYRSQRNVFFKPALWCHPRSLHLGNPVLQVHETWRSAQKCEQLMLRTKNVGRGKKDKRKKERLVIISYWCISKKLFWYFAVLLWNNLL